MCIRDSIGDDVREQFMQRVMAQCIHPELCATSGLKVIYTPLNGTGNKPVREVLRRLGISHVTVVPEQEHPDGNFPTCPYPNLSLIHISNTSARLWSCARNGAACSKT